MSYRLFPNFVQVQGVPKCLKLICLRFGPIVQGLLMKSNEQLRTESLILINAIITQPDDLDFRMHLRNEFMRVGLLDVLDVSRSSKLEDFGSFELDNSNSTVTTIGLA